MVAVCCVFVCRCVIRPRWREAKLSKRSARRRPRARLSAMLRHRWRRTLAVTAAATVSTATASSVNSAVSRSTIEAPVILSSSGKPLPATLLQVQTTFRHGARTPVTDDGCNDSVKWTVEETNKSALLASKAAAVSLVRPNGDVIDPVRLFRRSSQQLNGGGEAGRLTKIGLEQGLALGRELRSRYVDSRVTQFGDASSSTLLPSGWSAAQRRVYPRSTCVERTVYTCAGVLGGLFPELGNNPDAPTVDIQLNTAENDAGAEYMVLNDSQCPRLSTLFAQGLSLSTKNLDDEQKECISLIEKNSKWTCNSAEWTLITYRDWYACRVTAGKQVPDAVQAVAERLDAATTKQMNHIFEGGAPFTNKPEATRTESLKLSTGRMWSRILSTINQPDGGLHLYSGHDWTVSPLLLCITRHDDPVHLRWPPFCSNLSFELWSTRQEEQRDQPLNAIDCNVLPSSTKESKRDEGHHVRCVYNGRVVDLACAPRGQETCSLSDFKAMVRKYTLAEGWAAACRGRSQEEDKEVVPGGGDERVDSPRFNR